jgi:hypothetical protein
MKAKGLVGIERDVGAWLIGSGTHPTIFIVDGIVLQNN